MGNLTPEEIKWLRRVQRALDACPSQRIGFYTIGDKDVSLYDKSKDDEVNEFMDAHSRSDYPAAVEASNADLGTIIFPNQVHSVAG